MAFLRSALPEEYLEPIRGPRLTLRAPISADYPDWAELRALSRTHLTPWEPMWARDELSRSAFRRRLRAYACDARDDLGYSLLLGLIFWVGAEIQRLYQEVGVEIEKYHGNQAYFLPMAAKFIVGSDGLVKARQVNIEFRERMEPEAIITTLENLRAG